LEVNCRDRPLTPSVGSTDSFLQRGSIVRLYGLGRNACLNDMTGTCVTRHSKNSRWDVLLENGETVRLKEENLQRDDNGGCSPTSKDQMPCKDSIVTLVSLQHRPELNGTCGRCTSWHAETGRWDVEVLSAPAYNNVQKGHILSVDPTNLRKSRLPALSSNAGWRGKTVHSWIFADGQEEQEESGEQQAACLVVTVRMEQRPKGLSVVCTNMAGAEVAVVLAHQCKDTFCKVKESVAAFCGCDTRDVKFATADGKHLDGLDCWCLSEALARNA